MEIAAIIPQRTSIYLQGISEGAQSSNPALELDMIVCGLETLQTTKPLEEHSLIAVYNPIDDNLGFEWPEIDSIF